MTANGFKDMTGLRFGRLTVLKRFFSPSKSAKWLAACDCGETTIVHGAKLRNGHTQSCGCLRSHVARARELKHGLSRTPIYNRWRGILNRCRNPKADAYKWYGARGIDVCERWLSFDNFLADMGMPADGMELDRINPDGNYEPSNCAWVTHQANCQNRRNNRDAR